MVRFANSGSDLETLKNIFQAIYRELRQGSSFTLDQMSEVLVKANLATSSGHTGDKALALAYRKDRSRDKLFNNSKMYSEIFRLLGWICPTPESRQQFQITWLGDHLGRSGEHANELVNESVLGIVFPNNGVEAKGDFNLRPFATVIKMMQELDGLICRDEMIVGPLAMTDDRKKSEFKNVVSEIRVMRGKSPAKLFKAVVALSKDRKIQVNTLHNYTRFPISTLCWCGWTEKFDTSEPYGENMRFLKLTKRGEELVKRLKDTVDVRKADIDGLDGDVKSAVAVNGALHMVKRARFDISDYEKTMTENDSRLKKAGLLPEEGTPFLFSPFQELETKTVAGLFDIGNRASAEAIKTVAPRVEFKAFTVGETFVALTGYGKDEATITGKLAKEIEDCLKKCKTPHDAVEQLFGKYKKSNREVFYPLVTELFQILGFDCVLSRQGVNAERWDAFINHGSLSVPIEIKSPGEEMMISVKGVRQALENKVILTAREYRPSSKEASSLVVGYLMPNDRAEVGNLVADIDKIFGVKIGVIDFKSAISMAVAKVSGKGPKLTDILKLKGFINVG